MMECYLSIKRNEVLIYTTTLMNLENIVSEKKLAMEGHLLYDAICM